jgi:site-specific recombinase XerD
MRVAECGAGGHGVTVEGLLDEYIAHLRSHRDLVDSSLRRHRCYASAFLSEMAAGGSLCLVEAVNIEGVQSYATEYAKGHGHGAARNMLSTLRVLLHYLYIEGHLPRDLSAAVPSRQMRQLSHVPRGISDEDIERLLASIDRSQEIGKRDYAMLQMLSTYGIRGVQVRELKLDDIQWTENRIVFRPAKGGKQIIQHLTATVGNSLLEYLRHGRALHTPYREVFLTCLGTPRPLRKPGNLSAVVHNRLKAAGIDLPAGMSRGSHSFRHAFANRMVRGSQPFKHIADMLGHKILNSTMIYTKIDLPSLRQATQEWPEVSS